MLYGLLGAGIKEDRFMARTLAELPAGPRMMDYIRLGVIAKTFPVRQVQEILERCGRARRRQRSPARGRGYPAGPRGGV